MDNKLINKVITISSMEMKPGQYGQMAKIKDEEGRTYTVYEQKKDGSTSAAWEQMQTLKIGSLVQIAYSSEMKDYQGKPYEARTIRAFNEDIAQGMANTSAQGKTSNGGQFQASGSQSKDDAFWEKQAYEKCLSLWSAALIQNGKLDMLEQIKEGYFWELFQAIKAEGEKRFSPLRQSVERHAPRVITPEEPPIESYDEPSPVDPESIPF